MNPRISINYEASLYDQSDRLLPKSQDNFHLAAEAASRHLIGLMTLLSLVDEDKLDLQNSTDLANALEYVGEMGAKIADDILMNVDYLHNKQKGR